MQGVRKPLLLSFASKYSSGVIHFGSVVVLARLLTPEEFGIYSVGAGVIALAHTLRDFGTATYVIQEQKLDESKIRSAFGLTLLIAWGLALLLFLLSAPIAGFYKEPGLKIVISILSISFLLIPFSSISLALLRRDLAFNKLYWIETTSAIAHAGTSVTLAALGFGFASLAWGGVAGIVVTVLVVAITRPNALRLRPSFKKLGKVLSFGSKSSIAALASEFGHSAPDLIIGRMLGFEMVGYFSRAVGLTRLFDRMILDAIHPVALPYFASEHRRAGEIKDAYLRSIEYLVVVSWPFFSFLAVMAFPIVQLLYGPQWDQSVPLAQVLCLAMALASLNQVTAAATVSLGGIQRAVIAQVLYQAIRIGLLLIASFHDLMTICWFLVAGEFLGIFIFFRSLAPLAGVELFDYMPFMLKAGCLAAGTAAAPLVITIAIGPSPKESWIVLFLSLTCAATVWLVGIFVLDHPIRREIMKSVTALRGRSK